MGRRVASRVAKTPTFWAALFATALAAVLVYSNTLSYGAAWDDQRFVFASGATEGVSEIPEMFSHAMLRDMPAGRGAYRPVTTTSYALDWSIGNGQASFFHKTNVALHALVSVLVFLLLGRLGAPVLASALGALVFAAHPVHVEAVANIAGRSELLVALFSVGAAVVYLAPEPPAEGSAPHDGRSPLRTLVVLGLFVLALLSKEHGIMLPVVLMAVEVLRPGAVGSPLSRLVGRWPLWVGMAALSVGYFGVRKAVLGTITTSDVAPFIFVLPGWHRVTTAVANWAEYARLHLYPVDLSVDYGPALIMPAGPGDARFWLGLLVGAACLALSVWAYRRHRLGTLGVAWFAIVMLPSSNLLVPIAQWLAERFFYLPSVGLSMAVAATAVAISGRLSGRRLEVAGVGALLAVVLLAGRSWERNTDWVDTETVIATLIQDHPNAFRAQWYMGRLLFEQGRTEDAFQALDSATTLQPMAIEMPLERAEWLLRLGRAQEAADVVTALPFARHADREAHLVRALTAMDRRTEADSALAEARVVFPNNATLRALEDSLLALPAAPDTIR
jgi:protein O-mannosyl-transferase